VASRRVWSLMRAVCTASSVEDFVRTGPGSTLCQDKERCSASKVLLPGCMKEGSFAYLEFEGKARTHNKYNINAGQERVLLQYRGRGRGRGRGRETGSLVRSWRFSSLGKGLGLGEWAEGRCG
jgi:hypothetical protein